MRAVGAVLMGMLFCTEKRHGWLMTSDGVIQIKKAYIECKPCEWGGTVEMPAEDWKRLEAAILAAEPVGLDQAIVELVPLG